MSYFLEKMRTMHVCTKDNKMYTHGKKTQHKRLFAFLWLVALLWMSSCTTTRIVEHEVIKHDSIYITAVSVDTILHHDSIHVVERGDTITTTIYKYIYKVKERTDTMFVERTDTILKTEVKEVEKTKRVTDWRMCLYSLIVGAVMGFLAFVIYRKSVP